MVKLWCSPMKNIEFRVPPKPPLPIKLCEWSLLGCSIYDKSKGKNWNVISILSSIPSFLPSLQERYMYIFLAQGHFETRYGTESCDSSCLCLATPDSITTMWLRVCPCLSMDLCWHASMILFYDELAAGKFSTAVTRHVRWWYQKSQIQFDVMVLSVIESRRTCLS